MSKDEVRDKIEEILRASESFENSITSLAEYIKLQQEALLSKLEAELPFEFKTDGETEYFKGAKWGRNQTINTVKTTMDKLRLEL